MQYATITLASLRHVCKNGTVSPFLGVVRSTGPAWSGGSGSRGADSMFHGVVRLLTPR